MSRKKASSLSGSTVCPQAGVRASHTNFSGTVTVERGQLSHRAAALKSHQWWMTQELINRESRRVGEPRAWGVMRFTDLKSQVWGAGGHTTWNKWNVLDVKATRVLKWGQQGKTTLTFRKRTCFLPMKAHLERIQFRNYPMERGPMTGKTSVADYTWTLVLVCSTPLRRRTLLIS